MQLGTARSSDRISKDCVAKRRSSTAPSSVWRRPSAWALRRSLMPSVDVVTSWTSWRQGHPAAYPQSVKRSTPRQLAVPQILNGWNIFGDYSPQRLIRSADSSSFRPADSSATFFALRPLERTSNSSTLTDFTEGDCDTCDWVRANGAAGAAQPLNPAEFRSDATFAARPSSLSMRPTASSR